MGRHSLRLFVAATLIELATSIAFGQGGTNSSFNPNLTVAGNAATYDARRAALRWEARNSSGNKAAVEEFLSALKSATAAALPEPSVYVPIPACFELTFKNDGLKTAIQSMVQPVLPIKNEPVDLAGKLARLAFFEAQRDLQEGYCVAFGR